MGAPANNRKDSRSMNDSKQVAAAGKRRPPAAGKGRKPGSVNKTTKLLREAILEAAELCGQDGKGKDGTVGYLKSLAIAEPKAFAGLLGRVLPLQVTGAGDAPLSLVVGFVSPDGADAEG